MIPVHLRPMASQDIPEVLAIDHACFSPLGWSHDDIANVIRLRNVSTRVAESRNAVAGYAIWDVEKATYHIIRFAVDNGYRRQGVGRQLVGAVQGKLSYARPILTLCVRESNVAAQLFYRAHGFRVQAGAKGVRHGMYTDPREDGYEMVYEHGWPKEWHGDVTFAVEDDKGIDRVEDRDRIGRRLTDWSA